MKEFCDDLMSSTLKRIFQGNMEPEEAEEQVELVLVKIKDKMMLEVGRNHSRTREHENGYGTRKLRDQNRVDYGKFY